MKWYYLVRDDKIIDSLKAESTAQASYRFRHNTLNPAKVGDQVMVCAVTAMPLSEWEWVP